MANLSITWAGISSTTIPELHFGVVGRPLIGKPRGTLVPVPGKEGGWYFPEARGMRDIIVDAWVEVDDFADRRTILRQVATWLDLESQERLIFSDDPGVYYFAYVADITTPEEWRNTGTFKITWTAPPYANDEDPTIESFTATV